MFPAPYGQQIGTAPQHTAQQPNAATGPSRYNWGSGRTLGAS